MFNASIRSSWLSTPCIPPIICRPKLSVSKYQLHGSRQSVWQPRPCSKLAPCSRASGTTASVVAVQQSRLYAALTLPPPPLRHTTPAPPRIPTRARLSRRDLPTATAERPCRTPLRKRPARSRRRAAPGVGRARPATDGLRQVTRIGDSET